MRRRGLFTLICLSALLISGCRTASAPYTSAMPQDNLIVTGENDMAHIEMTSQEIELLCQNYQDADRIREGKLFSHQEEALRQLRAGTSYLAEKYPSQSFELLTFEAANKFSGRATIIFQDENAGQYTLYVTPSDDGCTCTDTFYAKFLREDYDKKVEAALAAGGYVAVSYTRFPAPVDAQLGEGATADDLLRLFPKLTRNTDLFLVSDDRDAVAAALRSILMQGGFYGAYTLYFVPELQPDADVSTLEAARSDWEYVGFNCFDI